MNLYITWSRYLNIYAAIILVSLFVPVSGYACANAVEPNVLLSDLSSEVIGQINENLENIKNDPTIATKLIENVLLPHLDFTFASKKALVFEWDNLSRKQKINFITSFRIFLVRHSSVILADFLISQNKKLDEDAIEFEDKYDSKGNFARVNSKVLSNRSETYNVGFRLHCDKSAWKIYDVVINGVSIIKQYKGQFRYKIDKDGFDGLIAFLNYKNDVMLAYQLGRQ